MVWVPQELHSQYKWESFQVVTGGWDEGFESYVGSNFELELDKGTDKGKQIIDVEPSAIISTTRIQRVEPENIEEGEHLFHS